MSYHTSSDTAPTLSNENTIDTVAPAITFVINAQGPGPFTFNLNFGSSSLPQVINFTVNANGDAEQSRLANSRQRGVPKLSSTAKRTITRKFLATPWKSATASESEVPETPPGMLVSCMPPRKKIRTESQEVNPGSSQLSSLADASDSEGDVTNYHNNEPVAVFSPMCKLVTPSRKRKLDRMEQKTGTNGEETKGTWRSEFKRSANM
ncbi:hypothetical protein B0H10DRAFT_2209592 [Mycena sp. CBHHK59/15]|nr:hypothetical protein B0H10DRAFT_2209592 [Mycena sp. CBHHK59/15]